jgi:superfamily I DNA/RNA helicase
MSRVSLRMRHDVRELMIMTQWLSRSRQSLEDLGGISQDKVVLQTIHGSKGLEYTARFIAAMDNGVLPSWNDDAKEARRVFYVALTRAKREIHLLWSGFWYTKEGKLRAKGPSVYLAELRKRLGVAATAR